MVIDAPPAIVIQHDAGGKLGEYIERRGRYLRGEIRVEVRGQCMSSCTILPITCVGPDAVLGFHAPVQTIAGRATATGGPYFAMVMMGYYSEPVLKWVEDHGGLTVDMIYLRGAELTAIYPRCR